MELELAEEALLLGVSWRSIPAPRGILGFFIALGRCHRMRAAHLGHCFINTVAEIISSYVGPGGGSVMATGPRTKPHPGAPPLVEPLAGAL
jgi:hypothetical protein